MEGKESHVFVGATKEGAMTECTRCGSNALRFVSVCANGEHLYQCANCMKVVAMDPNSMDSKESE
jgi:DNA-directed RNA polymerase subunit RPC12/RpoP